MTRGDARAVRARGRGPPPGAARGAGHARQHAARAPRGARGESGKTVFSKLDLLARHADQQSAFRG